MKSVCLRIRFGLLLAFLPLLTGTVISSASAVPLVVSKQAEMSPPVGIFFYINGILVDCTAASGYSQNHVFDLVSNEIVGYRDANNPGLILDAWGNLIGLINIPE